MRDISKKRDYRKCKACGKNSRFISRKGFCVDCASAKVLEEIAQLRLHKGESYIKWKEHLKESLENK